MRRAYRPSIERWPVPVPDPSVSAKAPPMQRLYQIYLCHRFISGASMLPDSLLELCMSGIVKAN